MFVILIFITYKYAFIWPKKLLKSLIFTSGTSCRPDGPDAGRDLRVRAIVACAHNNTPGTINGPPDPRLRTERAGV